MMPNRSRRGMPNRPRRGMPSRARPWGPRSAARPRAGAGPTGLEPALPAQQILRAQPAAAARPVLLRLLGGVELLGAFIAARLVGLRLLPLGGPARRRGGQRGGGVLDIRAAGPGTRDRKSGV